MNIKGRMKRLAVYLVFGIAIVTGCLAYPYLRFNFFNSDMSSGKSSIQAIAHRGVSALAPENTLGAFRLAMATADVIELDVHLTCDDSVVVMHDATIDRTTDGKGMIADLTYAELAALDAGSWFSGEFKGERVPSLAQVLDLVNGSRIVLIELKWPKKGIYRNLVTQVLKLIRERKAESWVIVQSFEYAYLRELYSVAPEVTTYQLLYGYLVFPPVYMNRNFHVGAYPVVEGVSGMAINYKFLSPSLVQEIHQKGLKIVAWTVNDPKDIRRAVNLGVDGIISDNPGVVRTEFGTTRP
jgi:glycerophosphoryl diester phosphodiesterase